MDVARAISKRLDDSRETIFRRGGELTEPRHERGVGVERQSHGVGVTQTACPCDEEHGGRSLRGSDDEEGHRRDKGAAGLFP